MKRATEASIRNKLNFPDTPLPDISEDRIDENREMISMDEIILFQEGVLTKLELIKRLRGEEK